MRILMATMSFDIGGAETHILELCRELCRLGHEVTVVSKGGVFVDALTKSGIRHVTAPLHKKDASCTILMCRNRQIPSHSCLSFRTVDLTTCW